MSSKNSSSRSFPTRNVGEYNEKDLSESWVTYNMNADDDQNNGISEKEIERLLCEAQRESGQSSLVGSSKSSKVGSSLPNTPCNSLQSTPECSGPASPKIQPTVEGKELPKTTQHNMPELVTNTVETTGTDWVWDWSSTPENRPPKKTQFKRPSSASMNLSIRKTKAMKSGYFSWEFLQIFIPSLVITNLVAFGIGVYVGKRLTARKIA